MFTRDANDQAKGFALRLREALEKRGKKPSPTALEREFNLRYRGQPITMHAARKWLLGLAIPTQDKLEVLARWLDVTDDWLRWGNGPEDMNSWTQSGNAATVSSVVAKHRAAYSTQEEGSLVQDWRLLEPRNKQLVRSIMELLLRDQHGSQQQKAK